MPNPGIQVPRMAHRRRGCKVQKRVPGEVYSRIVGYLRPVRNWNKGKRQEFQERTPYKVRNL